MPKASSNKTKGNTKPAGTEVLAIHKALDEKTDQLVREGRLKVVIGRDGKKYVVTLPISVGG